MVVCSDEVRKINYTEHLTVTVIDCKSVLDRQTTNIHTVFFNCKEKKGIMNTCIYVWII